MYRMLVVLSGCLLGTALLADDSPMETVLIPIVAKDVPGAHGSVWSSHLWVRNGGAQTLSFESDLREVLFDCVGVPCLQPEPLLPGESREIFPDTTAFGVEFKPNRLLYLRRELSSNVQFELRVQDSSRALDTWGTEIPVVRESDQITGSAVFLAVPINERFRESLRIYSAIREASTCEVVDIRVFEMESGATLVTFPATLTDEAGTGCEVPSLFPNSAEIHNLQDRLRGEAHFGLVGIVVTPRTTGLPFWAVVTVTNDETQHVTVITPQ